MTTVVEENVVVYACTCVNVKVIVSKSAVEWPLDVLRSDRTLEKDIQLARGVVPRIDVAQPLLTSRITLSASGSRAQSLTALRCVNCEKNVYAVDKVSQQQAGQSSSGSARSIGFTARESDGSGAASRTDTSKAHEDDASASLSTKKEVKEDSSETVAVLQPAVGVGVVWILAGCVAGNQAVADLETSDHYSRSFKLVVAPETNLKAANADDKGDNEQSADIRQSRLARTLSPQRGHRLLSSPHKRSSASPSPARRRKPLVLAEEEEERGDDLDTLHLLETLLPHLPSSILLDQPRTNGDTSLSPRRPASGGLGASLRSSDKAGSASKKLDANLDSQAIALLRSKHEEAQKAIYEFLKKKSAELVHLESTMRREGQQLRDAATHHANARKEHFSAVQSSLPTRDDGVRAVPEELDVSNASSGAVDGEESSSPLFVRRRPLVPQMEKTASQDSDSSRKLAPGAVGVPRREGQGSSSNEQGSFIGSYLSASFAMRGRDLPNVVQKEQERSKEDEEDWFAHKKRLRERYPHADHSALPSAVNSDDEDAVQVKKAMEGSTASVSEEEERRGRDRERNQGQGRRTASSNKTPTPPKKRSTESGQSQQSNVAGNEELSQSVRTMRGALKGKTTTSENRTAAGSEKKVAFASTTEEHEVTNTTLEDDAAMDVQNLEPGDPLFEIDEDIEGDEITPNSSDITLDGRSTALQQAKDDIIEETLQDEVRAGLADEDEDRVEGSVASSMPVAGSFSVMAQAESRRTGLRAVIKEEVDTNDDFDPASLRFDGRAVYATGESLAVASLVEDTLSDDVGRETTLSAPQPLAANDRIRVSRDAQQALLAGFPSERLQKQSAIGFRVAVGEAEARLSGLLAPHAPSHRNLYSSGRRKSASKKYKLDDVGEEDDDDDDDDDGDDDDASNKTKDTKRGADDDRNNSLAVKDALNPAADVSLLAQSVPIRAPTMVRRSSSTVHHDATSGFDLEPKTSLPYREKHLTPSLRKAMRVQRDSSSSAGGLPRHRPSLGAISDTSETTTASLGATSAQEVVPGRPPLSRDPSSTNLTSAKPIGIGGANVTASAGHREPEFKYSVPGSVTRGFDTFGAGSTNARSSVPKPQAGPLTSTLASAQSSPMLGSSADTGRSSSRVRSPRPPYVQPPPPSTTEMRLQPDAQHRPAPLKLASMTRSDEFEEDEEEQDIDDVLKFMHTMQNLKTFKRTGWYHHRIENPESIADHMYRMAILSLLLPENELDISKCVQLCLVHDMAEALVGDLTPLDGIPHEEKHRREKEAINHLVHDQLNGSRPAKRIEALWDEYEARESPESKAVKDLDRFELALQAVEYEKKYGTADLQPFFDGSTALIRQPRIQRWIRRLALERESTWKVTEYAYEQSMPADDENVVAPP